MRAPDRIEPVFLSQRIVLPADPPTTVETLARTRAESGRRITVDRHQPRMRWQFALEPSFDASIVRSHLERIVDAPFDWPPMQPWGHNYRAANWTVSADAAEGSIEVPVRDAAPRQARGAAYWDDVQPTTPDSSAWTAGRYAIGWDDHGYADAPTWADVLRSRTISLALEDRAGAAQTDWLAQVRPGDVLRFERSAVRWVEFEVRLPATILATSALIALEVPPSAAGAAVAAAAALAVGDGRAKIEVFDGGAGVGRAGRLVSLWSGQGAVDADTPTRLYRVAEVGAASLRFTKSLRHDVAADDVVYAEPTARVQYADAMLASLGGHASGGLVSQRVMLEEV